MASSSRIDPSTAAEIDRLATAVAKDPRSKEFLPLAAIKAHGVGRKFSVHSTSTIFLLLFRIHCLLCAF